MPFPWHKEHELLALTATGHRFDHGQPQGSRAEHRQLLALPCQKQESYFFSALGSPDRCDSEETGSQFWLGAPPRPPANLQPAAEQPTSLWLPSSKIGDRTALQSPTERGCGHLAALVLGKGKGGSRHSHTCITQARQITFITARDNLWIAFKLG